MSRIVRVCARIASPCNRRIGIRLGRRSRAAPLQKVGLMPRVKKRGNPRRGAGRAPTDVTRIGLVKRGQAQAQAQAQGISGACVWSWV